MQQKPKFVIFAHNATYDKLHQVATLGLTAAAMGKDVIVHSAVLDDQEIGTGAHRRDRFPPEYAGSADEVRRLLKEKKVPTISEMFQEARLVGRFRLIACSRPSNTWGSIPPPWPRTWTKSSVSPPFSASPADAGNEAVHLNSLSGLSSPRMCTCSLRSAHQIDELDQTDQIILSRAGHSHPLAILRQLAAAAIGGDRQADVLPEWHEQVVVGDPVSPRQLLTEGLLRLLRCVSSSRTPQRLLIR
ncbi:MAG: hypothetical protein KatS3mg082_2509 [Nitrospiraceae bacterium]|nr:MAG: hypothetical protein KatS3mg082_2509 [Nitrospiraceae bacterium]